MFSHWTSINSAPDEGSGGSGGIVNDSDVMAGQFRSNSSASAGQQRRVSTSANQKRGGIKGNNFEVEEEQGEEEEERPGLLLHQAVMHNNVELLQDLLQGDEKREVNAADKWGRSPLHTTVNYDSVECAQLLLTAGADPNRRCNTERAKLRTPLHVAAREGKCELVRLLLCYGADIEMEDAGGRNAVDLAETHGHLETQQALLEELSTRLKRRSELESQLFDAFQENDISAVRSLLEQMVPSDASRVINSTPSGISTLLYRASHTGSLEMVELLISYGADGRPHPITQYSPLYVACHTGRIKVAEALVRRFPHLVRVETIEKLFPLHAACFQGHSDIVKLLLQFPYEDSLMQRFSFGSESYVAPFDVNARDMNDQTPLHLAVMSGHYEAAKTLLRCRVRHNVAANAAATAMAVDATVGGKTTSGSTSSGVSSAISAATDVRRKLSSCEAGEELECLKSSSALNFEGRLGDDDDNEDLDVSNVVNVDVFLQPNYRQRRLSAECGVEEIEAAATADPNHQSSSASPSRSPASASPPPSKGFCPVEVDVYTVEGITALHAAVIHGHKDVADLLLKHGADVSLPIKIHPDAMSFAFLSGSHDVKDADHFDDPTESSATPSSSRQLRLTTVLEEAALLGNAAMVELLLTHGASLSVDMEKLLLGKLLKQELDDVIAVILKYKTHTDPEFKVNRKGVLKHMYGPSAAASATVAAPSEIYSSQNIIDNSAVYSTTPYYRHHPSTTCSLQAIAPSRPAPLRIPTHPVVVDWHHLHDRLDHVKTSWLETAAHAHNPFVHNDVGATTSTTMETTDGGTETSSTTKATTTATTSSPGISVISGSLALFAITRLDVSENGISQLPLALFQLSSLKLLNLAFNRICELPTSFSARLDDVNQEDSTSSAWSCICLEEIELQQNVVEEVPEQLFSLPALQRLNLSYNRIKNLPLQLWKAPSLRELNLSNNRLSQLPIGSCSRPAHPSLHFPKTPISPRRKDSRVDAAFHRDAEYAERGDSPKKSFVLAELTSSNLQEASPALARARARSSAKPDQNSATLQALLSPMQMTTSPLFPSSGGSNLTSNGALSTGASSDGAPSNGTPTNGTLTNGATAIMPPTNDAPLPVTSSSQHDLSDAKIGERDDLSFKPGHDDGDVDDNDGRSEANSQADTDEQNADSYEEDDIKMTPLSHATIWRHKVRADDSPWLNEEEDAATTLVEDRLDPKTPPEKSVGGGGGGGGERERKTDPPPKSSHILVVASQLTTLNLSNNSFAAVPVGLPCLAPKLSKLNLSKNGIVEVGAINSFPSSIKHLDLSGNNLESWPIPISETVREDEVYHCYGLTSAVATSSASSSRLAADFDAAAARNSPEAGQTPKVRQRAASRPRHPMACALSSSPSTTTTSSSSSSPLVAPSFHSPLSLQHFMMTRYCVHRRHWKLDHLKTLSTAHNRLHKIALSLEDALSSSSTASFSKPEVANALERRMKESKSCDEAERERAQTIASIPLNDSDPASSTSQPEKKVGSKKSWLLYPNLSHLDVSHNSIVVVPPTIAELSALTILNLSHNQAVVDLPPEMGLLNKLWNLDLKGIPSLGEPLFTMVSRRYKTTDIVGYLKSILEDAKPYARMKLMFVGIQGIGKTSLLNRLKEEGIINAGNSCGSHWTERVGADFGQAQQTSGENLSTVGVDLSDWTYEKKGGGKGGGGGGAGVNAKSSYGPVTFRTWDFGGQREYYATHQYFLSKRSLYLVIWRMTDGVKGLNEIYQWLINIQARAPNSPCIIVGTHFDEVEQKRSLFGTKRREYPEDFQQEMYDLIMSRFVRVLDPEKCGLPKVLGYVEVSCKTRHNIRKLANFIYDSVFDLRSQQGSSKLLLEEKIPATYLALEDVIANIAKDRRLAKKEPVLLKDQYVTEVLNVMNQKHSVTFRDQAELHQATQFLHDNGVLLHYDDISLKDVYFLDPQWLCDLLAHVVTIREINPFARNGVMKTKALNQLFTSKNHLFFCSQRVHSYILDLLGKFEVALTWDGDNLLIPSMLPPERHLRKGNRDTDIRVPLKNISLPQRSKSKEPPVNKNPSCCCSEETICLIKDHECCSRHGEKLCQKETPLPACLVKNCVCPNGAIVRLYLMSYFPSGFWSRLMTRLLADESFSDILKTLFVRERSGRGGGGGGGGCHLKEEEEDDDDESNEILDRLAEKVDSSRGEWVCWQTGIELRCFDVPVLRIREPQRELNLQRLFNNLRIPQVDYWRPAFHIQGGTTIPNMASGSTTPRKPSQPYHHPPHFPTPDSRFPTALPTHDGGGAQSPEEWHKLDHVSSSSILEVLLPNESLLIKAFKDGKPEVAKLAPSDAGMARLLSLSIDHIDNLLEDWYPDLGVRFMVSSQGKFLITRMSPCPSCVASVTTKPNKGGKDDHPSDGEKEDGLRCLRIDDGEDDDDSWELLDEDLNRKPAVVDLVTLEKQQREAFQNGPSPTSEYDVVSAFDPQNPTKRVCDELQLRSAKVKSDSIFCFMVESLISCSQSNETHVLCPSHGPVPLSRLTPDLLFHDLPSHMVISGSDVTLGRLLGKGAFGSVFGGAVYKKDHGQSFAVALKMLQPVHPGPDATGSQLQQFEMELRRWELEPLRGPCNSYLTARKELSILMQLDHANIVPLLGICLNPTSLVLSLAPLGALNTILKDYKRSGVRLCLTALQRVVLQVAQALAYLHRNMIVYRDLKSENVLAWSLPPPAAASYASAPDAAQTLVKLADYGISRASLPSGTKGYAGTDGFMAPEIIRFNGEEAYTEKVDCFSFGMFIYELVSLRRPFEGYEQVKDYVLDRGRPSLSKREMSYPTHVLDLMTLCWAHDPADRPAAEEIEAIAASPEFPHLAEATPLDPATVGDWATTTTGEGEGRGGGGGVGGERRVTQAVAVEAPTDRADDPDGGITDEVWMVVQNVSSSTSLPSSDPSPSISVMSFEGHLLLDTLKSFPVVGMHNNDENGKKMGNSDSGGWKRGVGGGGDDGSGEVGDGGHREDGALSASLSTIASSTTPPATPTTPVAHSTTEKALTTPISNLSSTTPTQPSPKPATASPSPSSVPPFHPAESSSSDQISHAVHHIISIMNHVWLCDSAGFIHIYCALTYQPLLSFPVANPASTVAAVAVSSDFPFKPDSTSAPNASKSASASMSCCGTQLLFVSAANQVFAALNDGNIVFCNVVAVGNHLPAAEVLDEVAKVEHKWLNQTLMQEVHYAGGGHGPRTLSMVAIPRRKRVFELWCGLSGKEAQLVVWYMGDMRYKRTLKHQGLKIRTNSSNFVPKTSSSATSISSSVAAHNPLTAASTFSAATVAAAAAAASSTPSAEPEPWEIGVTLMTADKHSLRNRGYSESATSSTSSLSTSSSSSSLTSTSVWTYVCPTGKVFRWDVAQKAQVGSLTVSDIDYGRRRNGSRSCERSRSERSSGEGCDALDSLLSSSSSCTVTSMTVMGGVLYLGRRDGVIVIVDAMLEPGTAPLRSVFRPHDSNIVSLVSVGGGGRGALGGAGGGDEKSRTGVKRTPSYRGSGVGSGGVVGSGGASGVGGVDVMMKSTSSIGGGGGGSGNYASSTSTSSNVWNPPWWVSRRRVVGEGAAPCPLMLSVGRGYRSLITAKCPTAAFSPAAVTHSSGANRNKNFVLSWFATEWDEVEED